MDLHTTVKIVKLMGAASEDPKISDEDLATIVELAVRPDELGYVVGHPQWVPTYNVFAALAKVWELKAARLTQAVNMAADGQSFALSQQFQHCLTMAERYRSKTSWTTEMQRESLITVNRNLATYYIG